MSYSLSSQEYNTTSNIRSVEKFINTISQVINSPSVTTQEFRSLINILLNLTTDCIKINSDGALIKGHVELIGSLLNQKTLVSSFASNIVSIERSKERSKEEHVIIAHVEQGEININSTSSLIRQRDFIFVFSACKITEITICTINTKKQPIADCDFNVIKISQANIP